MGVSLGTIFSTPTGTVGLVSRYMPVRDPLKGIIIKEPSSSQKVESLVVPEGKGKVGMTKTEH